MNLPALFLAVALSGIALGIAWLADAILRRSGARRPESSPSPFDADTTEFLLTLARRQNMRRPRNIPGVQP